jgi:hypothetical protein
MRATPVCHMKLLTRSPPSLELLPGALPWRLYLSVSFLCIGTAAAMGSGSGGGSTPLQQEVGSSAFKVYHESPVRT